MQEIVIKIPDEVKQAFDNAENNELKDGFYDHGGVIASAIRNGKVLPPGHGELRDTTTIAYKLADTDIYLTDNDWNEIGKAIGSAEVLVAADKEEA